MRSRDQWTNDEEESVRAFAPSERKRSQKVIDPLKRVQNASVHDHRPGMELILLSKLLRLRIIEQIRLNSRRHHIDLGRQDTVFQKPLTQFRKDGRDMV